MIQFDEKKKIFKIDTPNTSYVMGIVAGEYLAHLYYGQRMEETDLGYLLDYPEDYLGEVQINRGEQIIFLDKLPQEYPCHGTGDFRQNCLQVRGQQGSCGVELRYESYEIIQGKPFPDTSQPSPGSPL